MYIFTQYLYNKTPTFIIYLSFLTPTLLLHLYNNMPTLLLYLYYLILTFMVYLFIQNPTFLYYLYNLNHITYKFLAWSTTYIVNSIINIIHIFTIYLSSPLPILSIPIQSIHILSKYS
jgi:hypothetical protein